MAEVYRTTRVLQKVNRKKISGKSCQVASAPAYGPKSETVSPASCAQEEAKRVTDPHILQENVWLWGALQDFNSDAPFTWNSSTHHPPIPDQTESAGESLRAHQFYINYNAYHRCL